MISATASSSQEAQTQRKGWLWSAKPYVSILVKFPCYCPHFVPHAARCPCAASLCCRHVTRVQKWATYRFASRSNHMTIDPAALQALIESNSCTSAGHPVLACDGFVLPTQILFCRPRTRHLDLPHLTSILPPFDLNVYWFAGGLNLKVHGGIEKMKGDMAGGAAVLGAAEALSQIRPEGIEVDSPNPFRFKLAQSRFLSLHHSPRLLVSACVLGCLVSQQHPLC